MAAAQEEQQQGSPAATGGSDDPAPGDVVGRSVSGAATTAIVGLLSRAAGLLTTVVVTYFVGKAEYGNANLAMIVVSVLHAVTLLTPQQALLTRREGFDEASALVRFYVGWSGALLGALLLLGGPRVVAALGQPEAAPLLYLYLPAMLLERLAVVPAVRLYYTLRFRELAQLELWGNMAYVAVTIGTAVAGVGALCLPLGLLARHGVRLGLLRLRMHVTVWPGRPPWGQRERSLCRQVLAYTLPVHLAALGDFFSSYLDNVVVGKYYSAAAQGMYVVAYTLALTPLDTIAMHGATALVRAMGLQDQTGRRRTFLLSLRYLSLLLFPIGTLTALTAPTLEQVLLPPRWHGVAPVTAALCAGAMSMGIKRLSFAQLTTLQRPRAAAALDLLRLGLFALGLLAVGLLDRPRAHLSWVGWAVSASFVAGAAVGLHVSLRADGLRWRDGLLALLPPALGSAVAGAGLLFGQLALARLGLPGVVRLGLELGLGLALYVAYLRVAHGAVYHEAAGWLRARLRPAR